ncbi:hypothetical protein [Paraburkholderia phenazinium]|uniref:Uncharacterized protein n=1 Tax=Paraburkholderia phenazinium TaxID=60549 RepID=A0A1G7UM89_9BURK|nr:hypothetical protein [Paraburkholderia phenazinium]SDG48361.1 hypothetical protein SAMN05216466_103510 [Paraburkholderia phenazinium]
MKGGVWPNVRLSVIALAVAGSLAGTLGPTLAHAQSSEERASSAHAPRSRGLKLSHQPRNPNPNLDHPASDAMMRAAVPPDLDQRRRDGHMTPEERRLLRQHIEDAVRELYKR